MFLSNATDQVSHPYESSQNCNYVYLNVYILTQQTGRQQFVERRLAAISCTEHSLAFSIHVIVTSDGCSKQCERAAVRRIALLTAVVLK